MEGIKPWLLSFAEETIKLFQIDDSHGMQHFVNTYVNARTILADFRDVEVIAGMKKEDETEIICDAAFVHDLIDRKYIDENTGVKRLVEAFTRNNYPSEWIDIIIAIITNISFSKRVKRKKEGLPMIEPGPYALATAIVADADMLDGYDPRRVLIYQERKVAKCTDGSVRPESVRKWCKTIMVNRVLKYRDTYLTTDAAKKLAEPLHRAAEEYVAFWLADVVELYDYPAGL